jgi:hypothetical protein
MSPAKDQPDPVAAARAGYVFEGPALELGALLDEDSTFYGDLFAHVVAWGDELYLEDGLHRALRAALQQRHVLHARVLDLDAA